VVSSYCTTNVHTLFDTLTRPTHRTRPTGPIPHSNHFQHVPCHVWICGTSNCYVQAGASIKPIGCCGSTCCYGNNNDCCSSAHTCVACYPPEEGVAIGAIVGGTVGGAVFLCFFISIIVWWRCFRTARLTVKVDRQMVAAPVVSSSFATGGPPYASVPTYYGPGAAQVYRFGGVQTVGAPKMHPFGDVHMVAAPQVQAYPFGGYQMVSAPQPYPFGNTQMVATLPQGYPLGGVQVGEKTIAT
jgi:hypothetical protein